MLADTDRIHEERCFLRDILLSPDDDAPRLIFADRLDEWGETTRAEFIHLGCERASMDKGTPPEKRYAELFRQPGEEANRERYDDLLKRECYLSSGLSHWFSSRWDYPFVVVRNIGIRRGFIHEIECTARGWLDHAEQLIWTDDGNDGLPLLTASPIKHVTLTTSLPDNFFSAKQIDRLEQALRLSTTMMYNLYVSERRQQRTQERDQRILEEVWPGVKFEFKQNATMTFRATARGRTVNQ